MPLNDVPLSGQTLAVTQPLIRGNFSNINSAFNVNHVDYGLADAGKHKWITFPIQGSFPVFGPTEGGLVNFLDTFSGANQLFIQSPAGGAAFPMTANSKAQSGWSYLPTGIILQWGFSAMTGTTANVVFVATTGKNFTTAIFSVVATTGVFSGTNTPISIATPTVTGFTANSLTSVLTFYGIAIEY